MSQRGARNELEAGHTFDLIVYERRQRRYFRVPSRGRVLIGRSADCDLRLEDNSVSRRHALLHLGDLEVEDLGSKNGTALYKGQSGITWQLPLQTQVKLLHVLERGEVTRVGGTRSRQIDVRFVAATNRELSQQVQLGQFRKDLYFRLNAVSLKVVPLRKRSAEIEPLARYFLSRFCTLTNIPEPELTKAAVQHLHSYSWPGNIRELKNALERAPLLCGAGQILPRHLPLEEELTTSVDASLLADWAPESNLTLRERIDADDALPQARIAEALRVCAGNQTRAAMLLGVSRRTLVNRLNDYKLPRPRKRLL